MADLPALKRIVEPIADDYWSYVGPDGTRMTSRVIVGRLQSWPQDRPGDWICPVSIEHFADRVVPVASVGPVHALMNAVALVKAFAEQADPFTPRASAKPEAKRPPSRQVHANRSRSSKKASLWTDARAGNRKRSTG